MLSDIRHLQSCETGSQPATPSQVHQSVDVQATRNYSLERAHVHGCRGKTQMNKGCLLLPVSEMEGKRPSLSSGSADGIIRSRGPCSMSHAF